MASFVVDTFFSSSGPPKQFIGTSTAHIQQAVKTLQKGSSFEEPYSSYGSKTFYPLQTLSINIGTLYPDDVDESVFKLSPKKATKKMLAGDNYFNVDDVQAVNYSLLESGKGDDIISVDGNRASGYIGVIDAGPGDDLISLKLATDVENSNFRVFGGKGSDEFRVSRGSEYDFDFAYPIEIMDFEPGKDVINANFGSRKNKPKTRVIDGDLWLFNRISKEPVVILNDLTSLDGVDIIHDLMPL